MIDRTSPTDSDHPDSAPSAVTTPSHANTLIEDENGITEFPASVDTSSSPGILQSASTLAMKEGVSMDVDNPASATEPSDPMEVDQLSSTNVVAVIAPAWLTSLKMDVYLQECSDTKAWKMLVESLYKFEVGNKIIGVR